jgi:hypothetical protein
VSHSHIPVRHLLKQVDIYRANRDKRDARPEWVTAFIDNVADLFEPMFDDGRVGFDCQPIEDRWIVGMYLGGTEIVGGCDDGQFQHTDFQFDLMQLTELFSQVDELQWSAFPHRPDGDQMPASSFITVEGRVGEHAIRLQLYSVPPTDAGPALRQYQDGRCTPV